MPKINVKSLYIHIPFCKHICSYCDFCKMYYHEELANKYLTSLKSEIKSNYKNDLIDTIYIGGGTPSSLSLELLTKLFNILKMIKTSKSLEFSFEVNVSDITEELLVFLKTNQVNRISIGIETVNDKFLSLLERYHTKEEVYQKIMLTKQYFDNINVDFMYGFPGQTLDDLKDDLLFFETLEVTHISIYSLILEPNTKLFIHNVKPLEEDLEADMYFYIIEFLNKLGYIHYEVSNFAKKGYYSKHNLTYWNNESYYGFGLGATGYLDNYRITNTRSINHYNQGLFMLSKDYEDINIRMSNEMILGLRKIKGVNIKDFFNKYGKEIEEAFNIHDLVQQGLLKIKDGYMFIHKDYLYLSNQILERFIDIQE